MTEGSDTDREWPRLEDLDPRLQEAFEASFEENRELLEDLAEM